MAPACALLARHGVPYIAHVELGDKAEMVNQVARRIGANVIVMGTARKNSLTRLIEDSITHRVLERAEVPVEVIPGHSVSTLEWASVRAALALVLAWLVIDVYLV